MLGCKGRAPYKLLTVVTYQPSECKLDYLVVNHLTEKGRALLKKTLSHELEEDIPEIEYTPETQELLTQQEESNTSTDMTNTSEESSKRVSEGKQNPKQ